MNNIISRGDDYIMFNWNNNLIVGIDHIDNQHKVLFQEIYHLFYAMNNSHDKNQIIGTLNLLENYVIKHFNDEETIQKKYNYPGYNIQSEQHDQFRSVLSNLRKTIESAAISPEFIIYTQNKINEWWNNHINKQDKDLGNYLIDHSQA
jgi:hemerythrin-like metal-binding domain